MADTAVASGNPGGVNEAWWVPLVMGILAVLFGIMFLTQPAATAAWVALLVGFWWLASGVINLVSLFVDRTMWGWKLFSGILGLFAGLLVIDSVASKPVAAAVGLGTIYVFVLGIQGVIIGVIDLVKAFKGGGWGIGIIGVLSILFGLLLMSRPVIGALALPWVFGVLGIVFGIAAIVMAFRVRKMA